MEGEGIPELLELIDGGAHCMPPFFTPHLQSLGMSGGLCLLQHFSPHPCYHLGLSSLTWMVLITSSLDSLQQQRVSFKTQVRSCLFSAQNPLGLPISFRIEEKVLTVVYKALWDLCPLQPPLCLHWGSSGPHSPTGSTASCMLCVHTRDTPTKGLCPTVPGTHSFRSSHDSSL